MTDAPTPLVVALDTAPPDRGPISMQAPVKRPYDPKALLPAVASTLDLLSGCLDTLLTDPSLGVMATPQDIRLIKRDVKKARAHLKRVLGW